MALMINQSENQLALTSSIRCTHKAFHIAPRHELFENAKLLSSSCRDFILPIIRKDGEVCIRPFAVFGIIGFRLCQFYQMPYTPADKIVIALQVSVPTFICSQHFGYTLGD